MAAMQQQFAAEAAKRGMTPEEFAKKQREQLAADAAKLGLSPEQYVTQLRMRAMQQAQQQQQQMQAQRQGQASPQPGAQQGQSPAPQPQQPQQPQQHQVPVNAGQPPDPKALAVANFLKSQNLKPRTCILDGQRKDMIKGKLAVRFETSHQANAAGNTQSSEPFVQSNPPPTPKQQRRKTPCFHR
jgi:translocation protein SEC62